MIESKTSVPMIPMVQIAILDYYIKETTEDETLDDTGN